MMPQIGVSKILVADIGGTNVKFGFNIAGAAQDYHRLFSTRLLQDGDPILRLAAMVGDVIVETGIRPDVLVTTVPGFLDADEDKVLFAGNVQSLNGRRLASELSSELGFPVYLERDSVLALMGETVAGVGIGSTAVLGIYLGTGVGAAFIQNGKPFRGAGWALEIGHIPFGSEGRMLEGLRTDSLETYVSGRALQAIADEHGAPINDVFALSAVDGNSALNFAIEAFIDHITTAIGIATVLFSPDILILGGGVCEMSDFPKERIKALVERKGPFGQTGQTLDLRWAALGWRGVLNGAPLAVNAHLQRHAPADAALAMTSPTPFAGGKTHG
ncbi:ROK family protein [Rhizobium tumorigenes]|uniref:ROK family protein n=1 Tax=Rhizobium tumorigenes TaxID=2041385 RepID=A0AAF1KCA9_9HYPH|nr:ROK family protein [Rhizobium tumorigenes]WFR98809.1 ROK family protein [Rhizobium tumorigenes]